MFGNEQWVGTRRHVQWLSQRLPYNAADCSKVVRVGQWSGYDFQLITDTQPSDIERPVMSSTEEQTIPDIVSPMLLLWIYMCRLPLKFAVRTM